MSDCDRCDGQETNCWVLLRVTAGKLAGETYPRAHFAFVARCPFCQPVREQPE